MKNIKAAGHSKITIDLIKMIEFGINKLRRIFELIISNEKCLKECEDSDTVVL